MRDSLLDCAVDHFGRLGFEGAATRAIAADCGTAMSSITYHFGGKEGLYLAAAEHIAEQMREHHREALESLEAAAITSPLDATDRLIDLIDGFALTMLSDGSARWARFIMREQHEPTEAFDRIYSIAMRPLMEAYLTLIAVARPDLSEAERRATGFLLFGQTISLRAGRASLTRVLGLERITADAQALMRARIAAHARAILSAPPETLP